MYQWKQKKISIRNVKYYALGGKCGKWNIQSNAKAESI